ncbi:LysR family transcriptional regulator [Ectopseudomonas oleovorans]|jgi:DNA-binding transcriptional LysR family regulator|uniref:LysR family transcriptional regulator BsrA n=1 Tax=Ectopseudomonas oleovorans TaxID=301 RepID=UPI00244ADE58|nr:LysR family transcriptional regulator [Pseudomonas oleovorans]MDG9977216.1 LysR family transcriptional regulator [Pseudomonas oleovorans]MDH2197853.1 LysR family transcriptional regulator [Pseudomonas oleovorans]
MITNLRQLDLNLLLVFDALMQEQNLSRAAVRLHLSQSTVSNALARLRKQLGEPLFQRTARGMLPTPQAQVLYGPVREALHVLRTGLAPQAEIDSNSELTFRVSMNDYAQAVFLPVALTRLQALAPRLVLSVQSDDADTLVKRLRTGELDLAIDYLHFDDELRYEPLREEALVVVASAEHPDIQRQLTLAQYKEASHVSVHPRAGRGSPLEIVLGSARVQRKVKLLVPHYLAIPAVVSQSRLLGTIPKALAEHCAAQYDLQVFPLPMDLAPIQVSLIWHRQQDASVGLQWLRRQLQAAADI